VNHIGLPNLVAEKEIALELIQKDVHPKGLLKKHFAS